MQAPSGKCLQIDKILARQPLHVPGGRGAFASLIDGPDIQETASSHAHAAMNHPSARDSLNLLDDLMMANPPRPMNEGEYKKLVDYVMVQHNREQDTNFKAGIFWPRSIEFVASCVTIQDRIEAMYDTMRSYDATIRRNEAIYNKLIQDHKRHIKHLQKTQETLERELLTKNEEISAMEQTIALQCNNMNDLKAALNDLSTTINDLRTINPNMSVCEGRMTRSKKRKMNSNLLQSHPPPTPPPSSAPSAPSARPFARPTSATPCHPLPKTAFPVSRA